MNVNIIVKSLDILRPACACLIIVIYIGSTTITLRLYVKHARIVVLNQSAICIFH